MPDLLVYGGGDLGSLVPRWLEATRRIGVSLELHPRFDAVNHGGYLPLRIEVGQQAPGAAGGQPALFAAGPLSGGFELFFELFERPEPPAAGPGAAGPLSSQERMERSTFCAIIQISTDDGPASCIAAVVGALGLAEAAEGVVVEEETSCAWDPEAARAQAERYLSEVIAIAGRARREAPFRGWAGH